MASRIVAVVVVMAVVVALTALELVVDVQAAVVPGSPRVRGWSLVPNSPAAGVDTPNYYTTWATQG
jgi:hypothetical protein